MDFQRTAKLAPLAVGIAFFGLYTARWLFGVPVPDLLADGLSLAVAGGALFVGVLNARYGGEYWVTLAQPLALVVAFVGAEVIRDVVNYQQRLAPPPFQTYAYAVLLAVLFGTMAYVLGRQFRTHLPTGT